jgi:hypothetical protein
VNDLDFLRLSPEILFKPGEVALPSPVEDFHVPSEYRQRLTGAAINPQEALLCYLFGNSYKREEFLRPPISTDTLNPIESIVQYLYFLKKSVNTRNLDHARRVFARIVFNPNADGFFSLESSVYLEEQTDGINFCYSRGYIWRDVIEQLRDQKDDMIKTAKSIGFDGGAISSGILDLQSSLE